MLVLHLISSLRRGGMERQLCNIVSSTNGNGIDNHIVYFHKISSNYIQEYGIEEKVTFVDGKENPLRALMKTVKVLKPDILIAWGHKEAFWGLLLSAVYGCRFLNGSIRHGIFKNNLMGYVRLILLHLSRRVMANSKAGLKVNRLNRGFVLYNGIAENFFQNGRREKKQSPVSLISIGHLSKIKNYPVTLRALKILKEKNIGFVYKIYGEGPEKSHLEQLIAEYRLSGRVELKGNMPNLHRELIEADILVHASRGEGCCNAILEAMAAGLPVVVSDVGGNPEIVNSSFAFLFAPDDAAALSVHLQRLIQDNELRRQMGAAAHEYARREFSMEKMVANYHDILRQISKGE